MTDPIVRANDARALVNSELFREARANIEGKLQYLRRSVSPTNTAAHTNIILMDQLWGDLIGYFENIAQTGQIEEFHLRDAERKRTLLEQGIAMFRTGGRNTL